MSTNVAPDISVIIPVRDRATLLERALRSAIAQSWTSKEIIVIGDGPQPGIRAVIDQAAFREVRYHELPKPRGASAARNEGLRQARGLSVAFLDDDDEWDPSKLERQITILQKASPNTGVVYSRYALQSATERIEPWLPDPSTVSPLSFMVNTAFGASVPMIRKACFDEVAPFDETLPACQDKDLWIRLAARYGFAWVPDILVTVHIHGRQITADLASKIRAREHILRKHAELLTDQPKTEAKLLAKLGMLYCADGAFEKGRTLFTAALKLDLDQSDARAHLAQAERDPAEHRRQLLATHFRTMDGVTLFY